MTIPAANYYSREEREDIINGWTYQQVAEAVEKTNGQPTCDRSLFLCSASMYLGMSLEVEIWKSEGRFDYETLPYEGATFSYTGEADYMKRLKMLEDMRQQLIRTGYYRMGV
jgi:hypothetical protein